VKFDSLEVKMNMDMNSRMTSISSYGRFSSVTIPRNKIKEHSPDIIYTATPFSLFEVYFAQFHCKIV
jgi:hypothetical protein